jgi:hypothetical protein
MDALRSNDRQYASEIERNVALLGQEVMRLEIVLGVESPAELARERLQLQVEVLQSSLKTGAKGLSENSIVAQLASLCSIPCLAGPQLVDRITQLMAKCKNVVA